MASGNVLLSDKSNHCNLGTGDLVEPKKKRQVGFITPKLVNFFLDVNCATVVGCTCACCENEGSFVAFGPEGKYV